VGVSMARFVPQPFVALLVSVFASVALGGAWAVLGWGSGVTRVGPADMLVATLLVCWVAAGYQFPIHLRRSQKVEMTTVALYLMVVLLPSAPLASTCAALGVLAGEMLVRARRGNYYSDVATAVGRWIIVVLAGSIVEHVLGSDNTLYLVGVAAVVWLGDIVTLPLVISPMTGERPIQSMISNVRASALVDGPQYLLGMLGALAASVQVWALGLLVLPTILVYVALKNVKELQSNTRLILESMADTIDLRDPYTGGHSQRVAKGTAAILDSLGLSGPEVELIVSAARVHDIGKIGIPDYILNKPDRLTPEEEAIMQTHPDHGADLLKRYPDFVRGVEIIRHHHEAWDGTGYPQRLKGYDIPFGARVIAVADSYDAMTSDRPYRKAMSPSKAASILIQGRGKQWDSSIVDGFLRTIADQLEPDTIPTPSIAPQPLQSPQAAYSTGA
jgi:hypothetical protein